MGRCSSIYFYVLNSYLHEHLYFCIILLVYNSHYWLKSIFCVKGVCECAFIYLFQFLVNQPVSAEGKLIENCTFVQIALDVLMYLICSSLINRLNEFAVIVLHLEETGVNRGELGYGLNWENIHTWLSVIP